ncbi:TadE/TadG family type IV pilus assembly protein [Salirhabdus sp. Marseille-P4669]|uniref:TadE/TadG family type IV pilus assembly protein n=1 Tax=Salirhabdus sp. Marseille-P4669 TaxID=2042310 RepID=UPI000C7C04BD|nr:TadE family protein [Salirhabdus sp. Marseille-P4669]
MIKSERGQAIVELALALPILLLLVFGMIDFGRIFHTYLTLEHASREAARVASVGGDNNTVLQNVYLVANALDKERLEIQITPEADRDRGSYVTVTAIYPIEMITPFLEKLVNQPFIIKGETVMRVE